MDSDPRLRLVAEAAKVTIDAKPILLPSDSNDVWKIGELVLRICGSADRSRLQREALLLAHLPDEVLHVRLADAGIIDDLSWTLTHWVPGTMLSHAWADLDPATLRDLIIKPVSPDGVLPSWHPRRRLPMILRGPDYIEALLDDASATSP